MGIWSWGGRTRVYSLRVVCQWKIRVCAGGRQSWWLTPRRVEKEFEGKKEDSNALAGPIIAHVWEYLSENNSILTRFVSGIKKIHEYNAYEFIMFKRNTNFKISVATLT